MTTRSSLEQPITLGRWLRSLFFIIQMYLMMALMALFFTPWSLFDRRGAFAGIHTYCRYVRWSAAWMIGLKSEIRGPIPEGELLIAAKHQSFFDVILICSVVPRPKFIMKRAILWTPIVGWFATRIGCVSVNRNRRGAAIQKMLTDVAAGRAGPGQLIIYPQGTRAAPDARLPYKKGIGALYRDLGQTCVPAATNVGVFWPRRGIGRKPGLAIVEFLPALAPGQEVAAFMEALEHQVETASDALMAEVGYSRPN